jgi:amino acid transporter
LFSVAVPCRSTQLCEETKRADRNSPWAIILAIVVTSVCGFIFLVVLLFCVQVSKPFPAWSVILTQDYCIRVKMCAMQADLRAGSPANAIQLYLAGTWSAAFNVPSLQLYSFQILLAMKEMCRCLLQSLI